jgi:hypothetical protein
MPLIIYMEQPTGTVAHSFAPSPVGHLFAGCRRNAKPKFSFSFTRVAWKSVLRGDRLLWDLTLDGQAFGSRYRVAENRFVRVALLGLAGGGSREGPQRKTRPGT